MALLYQSDASVFPTGGALAAMPELDPLGTQPAPRHLTQKENAARADGQLGSVEFQAPVETCSFAYPRLFDKSLAVVSSLKSTGDDDGPEHLNPAR